MGLERRCQGGGPVSSITFDSDTGSTIEEYEGVQGTWDQDGVQDELHRIDPADGELYYVGRVYMNPGSATNSTGIAIETDNGTTTVPVEVVSGTSTKRAEADFHIGHPDELVIRESGDNDNGRTITYWVEVVKL